MTDDERTVIRGLDAPAATDEYRALRELTDRDAVGVSVTIVKLLDEGMLVQEEGELFATAAGVRAAYEN
jgi:hypothetical protein